MKTLETVLAELSETLDEINNNNSKAEKCSRCGAVEGEPHPTRGFEVILQPIHKHKADSPEVCVICRLDQLKRDAMETNTKPNPMNILRQYGLIIFFGIIAVLFFSGMIMAQPPGLPGSPSQAPIDGGLGLLAAAGGAYAIKKLRGGKGKTK